MPLGKRTKCGVLPSVEADGHASFFTISLGAAHQWCLLHHFTSSPENSLAVHMIFVPKGLLPRQLTISIDVVPVAFFCAPLAPATRVVAQFSFAKPPRIQGASI